MSYEITRDCRFGRRGKIVDYPTFMSANYEEQRTCFKEVVTYDNNSHYSNPNSSDSFLDPLASLLSSADDASSFSSSTDSSDHSSFDGFGGGDFGGGGASDDY
jgi:uncharacterized membrane protein YgcG